MQQTSDIALKPPANATTDRTGSDELRAGDLEGAKAEALFAREREARIRDQTDLEWLAAQRNLRA